MNPEKYQQLLQSHPATEDGFIHVVGWVVKNSEWKIYLHHAARLNEFLLPWGKVDHGESFADAMMRELHEELEITVTTLHQLSSIKYIVGGLKRCLHVFMIDEYTGTPTNTDSHKYDQYRAEILESDNEIGFAVNIDGTITDDVQDIMHSFVDLYHVYTVVPQLVDDLGLHWQYLGYDETLIDLAGHYYLYLDSDQQLYSLALV